MEKSFIKGQGLSVTLAHQQVSLISSTAVYSLSWSSSFFNLSSSILTKPHSHAIVIAGDVLKSRVTPNHSINYVKKTAHTGAIERSALSSGSKLSWFFVKFRYTGKGLKIKKGSSTATVLFNLGASHLSKIHYEASQLQILRTKKNTYTLISSNKHNNIQGCDMYRIRPYNIYTRRGVRVSRQSVVRRFGKVSQLAPKKKM
jgi:hypothetical protein